MFHFNMFDVRSSKMLFKTVYETIYEEIFETIYEKEVKRIFKLTVSIGFPIPKGFGGVSIPYNFCYENKCKDGKLSLFGGSKDIVSDAPVNNENYDIRTKFVFTKEVNGTDELFKWDSLKLLDFENSLPSEAPLFVHVQISNGKQDVTYAQLQQGVQKSGYGDLLDDYTEVKPYE